MVTWSAQTGEMDWWVEQLRPFTDHCVGSLVPAGFDSIGRLFHPIEAPTPHPDDDAQDQSVTWASVAAQNGRVAHPEMQLHAIATPVGQVPTRAIANHDPHCWTGDLPADETSLLVDVVRRHTSTPHDCWFGVWEGYGHLHGPSLARRHHSALPGKPLEPTPGLLPSDLVPGGPHNRQHYLLHGGLSDMATAQQLIGNQTPNLWWPTDRSWFVVTDIDFCWTFIGGTNQLIDELTETPGLEVLASGHEHRVTVDADHVNT